MKRTLTSLFSMLCLILTMFAGCSSDANNTADTNATGNINDAATETIAQGSGKTNAELIAKKYSGKNFGGSSVIIASCAPGQYTYRLRANMNEIYFETETGEIMDDSIYKRNIFAEELLNITIQPIWRDTADELVSLATQSIQAGDDVYDTMITRLDYTMNLASQKLLVDYNSLNVLNMDDNWWNRRLVDNFMINNKLFAIAGDINYFDDYANCFVVFNSRIAENYGLDNLYSKVKDGTWTADYFRSTALDATVDLNGDGILDVDNDQWGYITDPTGMIYELYNSGLSMTTTDNSGNIVLSYNNKLVDVVGKAFDFLKNDKVKLSETYGRVFADNRKLYCYINFSSLEKFRDMNDNFGALPAPKYDEATKNYTAYVSNGTTTAFSIPITNDNAEDTAIILDVLSAYSTDTVRVALYDYLLSEKLLRNEESIEMLNTYILGSGQYDIAGDLAWASDLRGLYRDVIKDTSNNFVSSFESKADSIKINLNIFLESFN